MCCNIRALSRRLLVPIVALAVPVAVWGQGAGGTINGTVTDATGAVIPGAQILIVNAETGVDTRSETGINGLYAVPNMPPGEYNIPASADGFKTGEVQLGGL